MQAHGGRLSGTIRRREFSFSFLRIDLTSTWGINFPRERNRSTSMGWKLCYITYRIKFIFRTMARKHCLRYDDKATDQRTPLTLFFFLLRTGQAHDSGDAAAVSVHCLQQSMGHGQLGASSGAVPRVGGEGGARVLALALWPCQGRRRKLSSNPGGESYEA